MVKTHPPTHFFSNLPLHFESTNHLSLGFLHPLGFLNFYYFNRFQHACNTKFVSSHQLIMNPSKKLAKKNLSSSSVMEGTDHLGENLDNI
jgi:hypothetical protein